MICEPCKTRRHEDCKGGTWCDCQHRASSRPYDLEPHLKAYEGTEYRGEHDPPNVWDLTYWDAGYSWCRSCMVWHRLPECAIDQDGYALAGDGERWAEHLEISQ